MHGRTVKGAWVQGRTGPFLPGAEQNNLLMMSWPIGPCYISHGWLEGKHPQYYDGGPQQPNGDKPTLINEQGIESAEEIPKLNPYTQLLAYRTFSMRKQINSFTASCLESFCIHSEAHPEITKCWSIDNFCKEAQDIEFLYAEEQEAIDYLTLYRSLLNKVKAYSETLLVYTPEEKKLVQYLYATILSRICQLEALQESRLVIDIQSSLNTAHRQMNALDDFERLKFIETYRSEFETQFNEKIKEAENFIDLLRKDLHTVSDQIEQQIQELLSQIQNLQKETERSRDALINEREKLKRLMQEKGIFGALSVILQGIGSLLPPAGPFITGLANSAINIIRNPSACFNEIEKIHENIQGLKGIMSPKTKTSSSSQTPSPPEKKSTIDSIKDVRDKLKPTMESARARYEEYKTDEEKIQALNAAIGDAEQAITKLQTYQGAVSGTFRNTLHQFEERLYHIQRELENKSVVAIEFNMLEIGRFFNMIKKGIKEFTTGFKAGDELIAIFHQMEEVIKVTENIYLHIHQYHDQITLANYLAHLHSASIKAVSMDPVNDERIKEFKHTIQRNLMLAYYSRAVMDPIF